MLYGPIKPSPVHSETASSINKQPLENWPGQHSPGACSSGLIQKAGGFDVMQLFNIVTTAAAAASNKPPADGSEACRGRGHQLLRTISCVIIQACSVGYNVTYIGQIYIDLVHLQRTRQPPDNGAFHMKLS